MRIAIMGAGGLGGYIGGRLAAASEDVFFIARGAHLDAMQKGGLRIESPYGDLHLPSVVTTATASDLDPVDVVLFTVKLWDTEQAAATLAPLVGPHTRLPQPAIRCDLMGLRRFSPTAGRGDALRALGRRLPKQELGNLSRGLGGA